MNINSSLQIRIDVLTKYVSGDIRKEEAAQALNLKERQFRRVVKKFKENGIAGLIHGNIGKSPPNKTNNSLKSKISSIYIKKYKGFNITHFIEKLPDENIKEALPSYGTIKEILYESGAITKKPRKKRKVHRPRERYSKEGLMVQIDGSHHRWFFGNPCCLNIIVDDATGKLLAGKFSKTETTLDSIDVIQIVLKKYGCFQMLYSDNAGIYGGGKRSGFSCVNRAMRKLGIIPIQANSPQAKGRVERAFRTLQDRLVMEMRLAGVSSIIEANKFLESYIDKYNEQFAVAAVDEESAFKKLPDDFNYDEVFYLSEARKVASGSLISYKSKKYIIETDLKVLLMNKYIEVRKYKKGDLKMYFGDTELKFKEWIEFKMTGS